MAGGKKSAETRKRLYGDDYFSQLAAKRKGKKSPGSGFSSKKVGPDGLTGRERASLAGKESAKKMWSVDEPEDTGYRRPLPEQFKKG